MVSQNVPRYVLYHRSQVFIQQWYPPWLRGAWSQDIDVQTQSRLLQHNMDVIYYNKRPKKLGTSACLFRDVAGQTIPHASPGTRPAVAPCGTTPQAVVPMTVHGTLTRPLLPTFEGRNLTYSSCHQVPTRHMSNAIKL